MPSGLYLVGSRAGAEANLMTANWVTQMATEPKLVGVGVEAGALTRRLIEQGKCFSVSVLAREDQAVVRKFSKPAPWDPAGPTLAGFPVRLARSGAPVLESALAWLDCELRQSVELGSHVWFVGEVVECAYPGPEGAEVLRMEDTRMSYGG